jgi:hypothetical protein
MRDQKRIDGAEAVGGTLLDSGRRARGLTQRPVRRGTDVLKAAGVTDVGVGLEAVKHVP